MLYLLSVRIGYAYTTGICMGGLGVSVIEESGLYSWAIAAHELGHRYGHQRKCFFADFFILFGTRFPFIDNMRNTF